MTGDDRAGDELLGRLRALAPELAAPPDVVQAARDAFGLRTLDAELAALVADSLESGTAVRGGPAVRLLSYEVGDVVVELQVTVDGANRQLLGELSGAAGPLRLDTPTRSYDVPLDDAGRFTAEVPAGALRLRFAGRDGAAVVTAWTSL